MSDIQTWYNNIPFFTRWWFTLSVAFPLAGRFGLISPYFAILNDQFIKNFQLWRPVTALFFYPIGGGSGFHFLMNLYFLYNYSVRLENGQYAGRPADYFFMLLFNWLSITLIGYWCGLMLLMDPMILSVLYVWSQLNQDQIVTFWFGTQFRAKFLPWVLLGFNMILGGGGMFEIIGIIVGHLYYFLVYKYPEINGGPSLLSTPSILYSYFPSVAGRGGFTYQPPASTASATRRETDSSNTAQRRIFGGHNWGRGQVLGNN